VFSDIFLDNAAVLSVTSYNGHGIVLHIMKCCASWHSTVKVLWIVTGFFVAVCLTLLEPVVLQKCYWTKNLTLFMF